MHKNPAVRRGIFFTGTDTGVGKTLIAGALAKALSDAGRRVGVMKPLESGCRREGGQLIPEDALFLKKMSGSTDDLSLICPYAFARPLAPGIAAQKEGIAIDLDRIAEAFNRIASRCDLVLVEGAGGLMVPVDEQHLTADLIRLLGLPLIIIARAALGTINHTLLTVKQAHAEGLDARGIILNTTGQEPDEAEETNPAAIRKFSRIPLLGVIPHIAEPDRQYPELLSSLVCAHLDLSLLQ
jgi:dethiobiotin synthetase